MTESNEPAVKTNPPVKPLNWWSLKNRPVGLKVDADESLAELKRSVGSQTLSQGLSGTFWWTLAILIGLHPDPNSGLAFMVGLICVASVVLDIASLWFKLGWRQMRILNNAVFFQPSLHWRFYTWLTFGRPADGGKLSWAAWGLATTGLPAVLLAIILRAASGT